jgi:ribosomal-protein-alanine N-acetyltransferase
MLQFGFDDMALNRIEATCDDLNVGSWRVMEKCGMRQEGLFRQHMFFKDRLRDTRQYAVLAEDWKATS